jgi:hypothetical protein
MSIFKVENSLSRIFIGKDKISCQKSWFIYFAFLMVHKAQKFIKNLCSRSACMAMLKNFCLAKTKNSLVEISINLIYTVLSHRNFSRLLNFQLHHFHRKTNSLQMQMLHPIQISRASHNAFCYISRFPILIRL